MAVQRCPSCGRAWDSTLCMACGHEAAPAMPPAMPPSKPATAASDTGSGFKPALQTASQLAPAAPRPTPPTMQAQQAVLVSSTAMVPGLDPRAADVTAESIPLPIQALPLSMAHKAALGRLWSGPASYAALFVAGFGVALALGVAVTWPKYDPAALLAAGRHEDVITVVDASSSAPADWQRIKGHALQARGDLEGMLKAYQLAVAGNAVDDLGLEHSVAALGNEKVASLAVKTLEDWPGDKVGELLLSASADQVWLRRHRATEVLNLRPASTPDMKLQAQVRNAVADVRSDVCEHKLAGVKALQGLADNAKAAPALKKAGAWNAVYDINAAVILRHRCLSEEIVRKTDTALAKVERE